MLSVSWECCFFWGKQGWGGFFFFFFLLYFLTRLVLLGNHSLLLLHLGSLLIAFWSMTFSMNCHILPHCYNFTPMMLPSTRCLLPSGGAAARRLRCPQEDAIRFLRVEIWEICQNRGCSGARGSGRAQAALRSLRQVAKVGGIRSTPCLCRFKHCFAACSA